MKLLKNLFNLSLLTLTLGQFTALYRQGGTNIYLFDIILSIFVIYGLFYFLYLKKSFVLPVVGVTLLFFSFMAMISLFRVIPLYSSSNLLVAFLYLLRWLIYLFSGLIVFSMLYQKVITPWHVINCFVWSGVLVSLLGFVQLIVFPDLSLISGEGWDPHKNRLFSTFLDPNFVGAYLNLVLVFMFDKYYSGQSPQKFTRQDVTVTCILILGLFLTFSRSAWLMFSVIIFFYGWFKSKALLLTFVIVAFSVYFAVPRIQTRLVGITDPADSAHFRLISWGNALKVVDDNPLLGVGFNTFRFVQKEYGFVDYAGFEAHGASGADSSLLFVLATTGIFGFLFFLGSFVQAFFNSKTVVLKAFIVSLLVGSFFINSLFYPQILFLWVIVLLSYSFFDT